MSEECPICYEDKVCLKGMCGHHICEDCYEGLPLKNKKCPLCRGNYNGLNDGWFMECIEAKEYVFQGEKSLWKMFKSREDEDTVEREDEYSDWKYEYLHERIDEYVTIMDKEGLNAFLSSYGFGMALSDYTDEYGSGSLPLPFALKIEKCLVYHKIHTFLREFL